jgi:ABC-2 type transport system ATP-binding protein
MVTTHYMDEAEYCSMVGIMRAGRLLALDEPGRLKKSLPGQVWEVTAEPLLAALKVMEGLPGVLRAALASDHLRLVANLEVDAGQISRGLEEAGLAVQSVKQGEASIEDVFMTLQ